MEYLIIELEPRAHIVTKCEVGTYPVEEEYDPLIFTDKNSAFRQADRCKKGLVYPIVDIMKILAEIKLLAKDKNHSDSFILDQLLALTDEIL